MMEMGAPYNGLEVASFMSCSKGYMGELGIRGVYAEVVNMDLDGATLVAVTQKGQVFKSPANMLQVDGSTEDVDEVDNNKSEYCKEVLTKLQREYYDKFEVLNLCNKFEVGECVQIDFSKQKLMLEKRVLEELLKLGDDGDYSRLLAETKMRLDMDIEHGYPCSLIGCLFKSYRHRDYIKHMKTVHVKEGRFLCKYKNECQRCFSSVSLLIEHIRESHKSIPNPRARANAASSATDLACKCNLHSCSGRQFPNLKLFLSHINNDHNNEVRCCVFENCDTKFKEKSASRHHFRRKHVNLNLTKLKSKHIVHSDRGVTTEEFNDFNINPGMEETGNRGIGDSDDEVYDNATLDILEEDDGCLNEEDEQYYTKSLADFYNRMSNFKFVPSKTLQAMASEFVEQSLKSAGHREKLLKDSLRSIPGISEEKITEISTKVFQDDKTLKAQKDLCTEYKRSLYIKEHFKYVDPIEVVLNQDEVKLGKPKEVYHYVPIIPSMKHLLEDRTFIEVLEKERNKDIPEKDILRDIKDGSMYECVDYFIKNPEAFVGVLYSDAVELTNPLSFAKGKHKIVQVFWTLADIPKSQRSQIDRINLALIVKEKVLKKYGYKIVYKKLLDDMKKMEEGFDIQLPFPRKVKCGFLVHAGDNLESHTVGGFSSCFSSKDICRFCHASYTDLVDHIHDYDGEEPHSYWNIPEYDSIVNRLEAAQAEENDVDDLAEVSVSQLEMNMFSEINEESASMEENEHSEHDDTESDFEEENIDDDTSDNNNNYGLRKRCIFNELKAFHAVYSFPPDVLHDVFEGIVAQDLCGIIKILSLKFRFKLDEYNGSLQKHSYKRYESNDRPQEIKNMKALKLPGKAVSLWTHMRNFGFIIKPFVTDEEDEVLALGIKLAEIVERLTAVEFRPYEVDVLEDKILEYLDDRKVVYGDYPVLLGRPKPKTHFLVHYPQAIRKFGPPFSYWTGRYESKHRVAKNTAESCKNFKNITATCSVRQQLRKASTFYNGMFETATIKPHEKVVMKREIPDDTEFNRNLKQFMSDKDFICNEAFIEGSTYKNGDLIVLDVDGRNFVKVGLIQTILLKSVLVYFVVQRYEAQRVNLGYFITQDKEEQQSAFVSASRLIDHKPLIMHGTVKKFKFALHHHISSNPS